jgi:hypothetical protein
MSIDQKDLCEKHYHEFDGLKECPLCVRDERDWLRSIASENEKQCRAWSEQHGKRMDQIEAMETELDRLQTAEYAWNCERQTLILARERLREVIDSVKVGLLNGLRTDGEHHKQHDMWTCLVEIVGREEAERLRDDEEEGFEEGIPA